MSVGNGFHQRISYRGVGCFNIAWIGKPGVAVSDESKGDIGRDLQVDRDCRTGLPLLRVLVGT